MSQAESLPLLVVDDEELNRDMLERRLLRRGFEVVLASGGAEALAIIGSVPLDLVLLDIMMPEIDGLEVLRRLRVDFDPSALPVIMVTARDDTATVVKCLDNGANDYITKPIDFSVLNARVEAALRAKRAEAALRIAHDEAQAANLAKSQFLASMSHELRTPLNSIIGFSGILQKKWSDPASQEHTFIERINQNGQHLLTLINDVLDLSKIEAGHVDLELADVDLSTLVRETVDLTQGRLLNDGVKLHIDIPEQLSSLRADQVRLRQVVINLLSNAAKFTEEGAIVVRVEANDADEPVALEVQDSGIGIAPENLERVFAAFQQADNSTSRKYGGTGLGLAITRQLVEMMQFSIHATSEPGVGSTFRIEFSSPPIDRPASTSAQSV